MRRESVRTTGDALAYLTDCTLATVESMAMLKGRKKGEFERQISIAQFGVHQMIIYGVDATGTRAADVAKFENSVRRWVDSFDVLPK
jgi:hypothetical protein